MLQVLQPRCAATDSCDGVRSANTTQSLQNGQVAFMMTTMHLHTGFCGRSESCNTMDLDWLSRSVVVCEVLMRICTAGG